VQTARKHASAANFKAGFSRFARANAGYPFGTWGPENLVGISVYTMPLALGFVVAFAASYFIAQGLDVVFEFSAGWIVAAVLIAIGGSLIGALYPAWRASGIDPVEVMVNE